MMTKDMPLIICDNEADIPANFDLVDFFSLQNASSLWTPEVLLYNDFLEKLVFQISRKPKALLAHLQRIYYCFHAHKTEQLFAAILDFLIVLNRCGLAISWRVVMGAKPHLTSEQFAHLRNYLQDSHVDVHSLKGNCYSLFTKGLIGVNELVRLVEDEVQETHDPIMIARDHIEYCQLDEAKHVLEAAVLAQPKRLDFQEELLELYRSTRDAHAFNLLFSQLTESGITLDDRWHTLNNYFKGQNNNG